MGGERTGAELAVAAFGDGGDVSGVVVCGLWGVDGAGGGARVVGSLAGVALAGVWGGVVGDCFLVSLDVYGEGIEGVV